MGAGCTVRLEVRPSPIEGVGLFWDDACGGEEGQRLGRFSGRVVFASDSQDAAEDWALKQADDRLIMLRLDGQWAIVWTLAGVFLSLRTMQRRGTPFCTSQKRASLSCRPMLRNPQS